LEELGDLLAEAASAAASPVGVMFHHELMDDDELTRAGELLELLAAHTAARCHLMSSLAQSHCRSIAPLAAVQGGPLRAHDEAASTPAVRS
jgi:hypothetical protein